MNKQEIKTQINQLQESAINLFKEHCKDLFIKYPEIKTVTLQTWIPGFNDGEECSFTTNFEYPIVNGDDENDENELPDKVAKYLTEIIANEQYIQFALGTNKEITITPENIEITDYDCGY